MSVMFNIKNKKNLFSYANVLSLEQCMNLVEDLIQFTYDETEEGFDIETFYNQPISELGVLVMGIDECSGRGFELSYGDEIKSYEIRVNTPATTNDWQIAIQFMRELAHIMGTNIVNEKGEQYTVESITEYDYQSDIKYGIEAFCNRAMNGQSSIIFGINRPISIDHEIAEYILNSSDMIEKFEELVENTQYVDAYTANQRFYNNKENDEVIGVYTLTQELDTILPYKPYIEFENLEMMEGRKVSKWELTLVIYEDENDFDSYQVLDTVDYHDFMSKLDKSKYRYIDGTYIVVSGLTQAEMKSIIK